MRFDLFLATILVKETLRFLKIPTALSLNTIGQQTGGDFQPHYVLIAKLPHNGINIMWNTQYLIRPHTIPYFTKIGGHIRKHTVEKSYKNATLCVLF